jgi:hypothetical protein
MLQGALIALDDREAEEARQKEAKKREAEQALKVCPDGYIRCPAPSPMA